MTLSINEQFADISNCINIVDVLDKLLRRKTDPVPQTEQIDIQKLTEWRAKLLKLILTSEDLVFNDIKKLLFILSNATRRGSPVPSLANAPISINSTGVAMVIKVNKVLDLTGAGDLFAAGFLKEYLDNSDVKKCLETGSILASKIIQKIGARLE